MPRKPKPDIDPDSLALTSGFTADTSLAHQRYGESDDEELDIPDVEIDTSVPLLECLWQSCGQKFWILDDFLNHINSRHINPNEKKPACEWTGCPRFGKANTSKFALLGHMRSHTGEKPFTCPRPECDKCFTRTDALQKHLRIQHEELLSGTRKPPTKKQRTSSKKEDEDETETPAPEMFDAEGNSIAAIDPTLDVSAIDEALIDDDLVLQAIHNNPDKDPDHVRYLLMAAKYQYIVEEHHTLKNELAIFEQKEQYLREQKENLLDGVLRKELNQSERLEGLLQPVEHTIIPLKWSAKTRTSLPGNAEALARALKARTLQGPQESDEE